MVRPGVATIALALIMNRHAAVCLVMMSHIKRDFCNGMCGLVNRPRRNRNAHAKRQPDKGKQAQERANEVKHDAISKICWKNWQSGKLQGVPQG